LCPLGSTGKVNKTVVVYFISY